MSGRPNDARSLLKVPGMKVFAKRIVNETTDLAEIYGAKYSDEYPMPALQRRRYVVGPRLSVIGRTVHPNAAQFGIASSVDRVQP